MHIENTNSEKHGKEPRIAADRRACSPSAKIATSKLTHVTIESMIAVIASAAQIDADVEPADVDPLIAGRDRRRCSPGCQIRAARAPSADTNEQTADSRQRQPARQMALFAKQLRPEQRRHDRRRPAGRPGSATDQMLRVFGIMRTTNNEWSVDQRRLKTSSMRRRSPPGSAFVVRQPG